MFKTNYIATRSACLILTMATVSDAPCDGDSLCLKFFHCSIKHLSANQCLTEKKSGSLQFTAFTLKTFPIITSYKKTADPTIPYVFQS